MDEVNPEYLTADNQQQISHHFQKEHNPSVTLYQFFTPDFLLNLDRQITSQELVSKTFASKYSYKLAQLPSDLNRLFASRDFLDLISSLVSTKVRKIIPEIRVFSHKSYTLLHDEEVEEPGTDLLIDLTKSWNDDWGGYVVYTDTAGQSSILDHGWGVASIVTRGDNLQKFVKYVNHHASHPRVLLFASLVFD